MSFSNTDGWNSFLRLVRFVTAYTLVVVTLLYLLPMAAAHIEQKYDALSRSARFLSVLGFFVIIGAWYVIGQRDRWRRGAQPHTQGRSWR